MTRIVVTKLWKIIWKCFFLENGHNCLNVIWKHYYMIFTLSLYVNSVMKLWIVHSWTMFIMVLFCKYCSVIGYTNMLVHMYEVYHGDFHLVLCCFSNQCWRNIWTWKLEIKIQTHTNFVFTPTLILKQEGPEGPGSLTWGKGQRSQWSQ